MSRHCARLFLIGCCFLTFYPPAIGQQPDQRVDGHGDPLPEGAAARLGTMRFRDEGYGMAALSPDGKVLATTGSREHIRLWDVPTGRLLRQFTGDRIGFQSLTFSPDSTLLATMGHDGIGFHDVATGNEVRRINEPRSITRSRGLVFSADGKLLAIGKDSWQEGKVRVWESATGKDVAQVDAVQNFSVNVALSPDGKVLATWGRHISRANDDRTKEQEYNQTLQVWDVAAGKELHRLKSEHGFSQVAFTPDGQGLATVSSTGIQLWETATGKSVRTFSGRAGIGHYLAFSPDGKVLAGATTEGVVQLWEPATGRRLSIHEGPKCVFGGLVFTPGARMLAWGKDAQAILLWEVQTGKLLTPPGGHRGGVRALAFLSGGKTLASAGTEGDVCFWDPATGKEARRFSLMAGSSDRLARLRSSRGSPLAFSPDGQYMVAGGDYRGVSLIDLASGQEVATFTARTLDVQWVAFSADSKLLAVTGRGKAVHLWDVQTGQQLREFQGPQNDVHGVAFSPDSKMLAVCCTTQDHRSGEIFIWETDTAKQLQHLPAQRTQGQSLAFSPDGTILAARDSGGIRLWHPATGKELGQMAGVASSPIVFAPNGRLLATAGQNNAQKETAVVQIWEVASQTMRQEFDGHRGSVLSLAFSTDGRTLATGGMDTSVLLWNLRDSLPAPAKLSPKELADLWSDLAATNARDGYQAMLKLAAATEAVAFLKLQLKPVDGKPTDEASITRLIAGLDDDMFETREKANRELEQIGKMAEPQLRKTLADNPSPEVRRRVEQLIDKLETPGPPLEILRPLRALEVLETIGTPEAREHLQALAAGKPDARLTLEAKAALERWPARGEK